MNDQSSEMQLHDVTDYTSIRDYVLRVRFDDGAEQVIDFEPILIGPLFGPLRDPGLFNQVRVDPELGTLVWPTGADIAPNVLYDWPRHVDAIVQRRRQRWAADYSVPGNRSQPDRAVYKVAETNLEPYEADLPPDAEE
jgi:hypothetical protein